MISRIAWLAFGSLLAGAAPAPEAKDANPIRILPGGVASADGTTGFVANDKGGVTALDLETGKPLWESKTAGRPVADVGGWVWVLTQDKDKPNILRLVGLMRDHGKAATQSDPIVLPDWVSAVEGVGAGRSFAVSASLDGNHALLKWQADAWYWGGAAPTPQQEAAARKHADGVARVNLETNEVELLDAAKAPAVGPKVSDKLRNAAARNYGDGGLTVAVAGDCAVAVDLESMGEKQKVVLKRWDLTTEKTLDPIVLAQGALYKTVTLPSSGVVLWCDATPPAGDAPQSWTWTVCDLATGKEMGRFSAELLAEDFSVIGPRAYYVLKDLIPVPVGGVLPRTLKAMDLKTGKQLWEQPLEAERLPPPAPK